MLPLPTTSVQSLLHSPHSELNEQQEYIYATEVKIIMMRSSFLKMENVASNQLDLSMRIEECYVLLILLYGLEAGTLMQVALNKKSSRSI